MSRPITPATPLRRIARLMLVLVLAGLGVLPAGALQVGSHVKAVPATLNVRQTPAGTPIGTHAAGDTGVIVEGPVTATLVSTSYVWWRVDWATGVDGWSFEGGLETTDLTYGIDVSHWQGLINWTSVRADGIVYAITKATEGTTITDSRFTTNMTAGRAAGVIMGTYHFARPGSTPDITSDALSEARAYVKAIHPWLDDGGLRPVLDLEDGTALGKAGLSQWARVWCAEVRRLTTIDPFIYTGRSYAQSYVESDLAVYPLWIAVPETVPGQTGFNLGPWDRWTIQQYSWTGTVPGITGNVDLNAFAGSPADLNAHVLPPLTHVLGNAAVFPLAAVRGNAVTLSATVTSSAARSLLLGASFYPAGSTSGGFSDGANDVPVTLSAGSSDVQRSFNLPAAMPAGSYDLWLALYLDLNDSGTIDTGDLSVGTVYKKPAALTVRTAPDFTTWAAALGQPALSATADTDADGRNNLTEYAFGTSPLVRDPLSPLTISRVPGGSVIIQFPRYPDRTDLRLTIEQSTNLTSWTPLATSLNGAPFSGSGVSESGTSPVSVIVSLPGTAAAGYVRVRVVR